MSTVIPRHVICVLGNWRDLGEVNAILRQEGFSEFELDLEFSQVSPDERMMDSFDASYDRVSPSMSDADWSAVKNHRAVVYLLSPPIRKVRAAYHSGRALLLTAALLRHGGVAAKGESAGIAHGRERWLELAERFTQAKENGDTYSQGATLYWA